MGGGVSLPAVPLSAAQMDALQSRYAVLTSEGKTEDEINAELKASLPAVVVFNQLDCDHTGAVTKSNVHKLLRAMPKIKPPVPSGGWPNGVSPKFVPLEEMLTEFDDNGDGVISLDEFVAHLKAAPALWQAIHNNIDPGTGKLKGYVSLEQQLAELEAKAAPLDAKQKAADAEGGDPSIFSAPERQALASLNARIAPLRAVVGSAGLTMFRQINTDGSGHVSRADLLAALAKIPPLPAAAVATASAELKEEEKSSGDGVDSSSSSSRGEATSATSSREGEAVVAVEAAAGSVNAATTTAEARDAHATPVEASSAENGSSSSSSSSSSAATAEVESNSPLEVQAAAPVEGRHVSKAEEAFAADGATEATVDGLLKELDVDGDGTVDEDEWVAMLTRLPYLKAMLEASVDPATGRIKAELGVGSATAKVVQNDMTEGDEDEEEDNF